MKTILRSLLLTLAIAASASPAFAQNILLQPAASPAKNGANGLPKPHRDLGEVILRAMATMERALPSPLVPSVFNQITQPLPGVVQPALPDQVVKSLPGQLEGSLPGQVVRSLPGQVQPALPGQVVKALPGQSVHSLPGR